MDVTELKHVNVQALVEKGMLKAVSVSNSFTTVCWSRS